MRRHNSYPDMDNELHSVLMIRDSTLKIGYKSIQCNDTHFYTELKYSELFKYPLPRILGSLHQSEYQVWSLGYGFLQF